MDTCATSVLTRCERRCARDEDWFFILGHIGGLELGLELAGVGETVWQVEKDEFCRAVLAKHWPEAERFDDVCTVGRATLAPVDLICGGFPCQDVSSAGKGAGLAGERSGLWREYARIVAELRPEWVVVENVTSGARRWLDAVVCELDSLGYGCLPCPVSARDVGAPHLRERLFVVAHADHRWKLQPRGQRQERERSQDGATPDAHVVAGQPGRSAGERDATQLSVTGRGHQDSSLADAHDTRREGPWTQAHEGRERSRGHDGWSSEPGLVPLVHGVSGGLAGRRRRARIRALGNAVVPQCAEVIGWVIRELAEAGEA